MRRYAIVCLSKIYDNFGADAIPDLEDKLKEILLKETDLTTKRNSFLLYYKISKESAIDFLAEAIKEDDHESFGDILQLVILNTFQGTIQKDPKSSSKLIKIIKSFSNSRFNSVLYEVANTLIRYTTSSENLRMALNIHQTILKNNTDNNVKLLILDQLDIIRKKNKQVIAEDFLNLQKISFSSCFEVKERFLVFCLHFVTPRNYQDVQRYFAEDIKTITE